MKLRLNALRLLAVAVVVTLLFSGFAIVQSYASNESVQPAGAGEQTVIASPGDTLWEIAAAAKRPGLDTRKAVYLIKDRNGLEDGALQAGEILVIPASVLAP